MRVTHGIEEPREGRDIPGQSLIEHLLFEIILNIRLQRLAVFRLHVMQGNHSAIERTEQIKVSHLGRDERVHLETPGAASKQIRLSTFQLPCAGAAQDKL